MNIKHSINKNDYDGSYKEKLVLSDKDNNPILMIRDNSVHFSFEASRKEIDDALDYSLNIIWASDKIRAAALFKIIHRLQETIIEEHCL